MIRKYSEIFCWKNVSSFCSAKATHIFSAKNFRKLYIESAKIVNEMALNELVKLTTLWTTGPCSLRVLYNSKFNMFRDKCCRCNEGPLCVQVNHAMRKYDILAYKEREKLHQAAY